MQSKERRERVRQLILASPAVTQEELVARLQAEGFAATQSTLSRDLAELGAVKRRGAYHLPEAADSPWTRAGFLSAAPAGPNLVVARTEVGAAQRVGILLDQAGFDGVVGTLAGDDTIFIAVESALAQQTVLGALGVAG